MLGTLLLGNETMTPANFSTTCHSKQPTTPISFLYDGWNVLPYCTNISPTLSGFRLVLIWALWLCTFTCMFLCQSMLIIVYLLCLQPLVIIYSWLFTFSCEWVSHMPSWLLLWLWYRQQCKTGPVVWFFQNTHWTIKYDSTNIQR